MHQTFKNYASHRNYLIGFASEFASQKPCLSNWYLVGLGPLTGAQVSPMQGFKKRPQPLRNAVT
ncbi:hypothetical protein CsSME_00053768 [Camellia sinensis var. sinensis]